MSQSEYLASLLKLIIQTKQIALNYAFRILLNSASAIQPFSGVKSTQNKSFRLDNLTRAPILKHAAALSARTALRHRWIVSPKFPDHADRTRYINEPCNGYAKMM